MPLEIELKARVADHAAFRRLLEASGARPLGPRVLEDNWLLDAPGGRRLGEGESLRVRAVGGRAVLTWKGARQVDGALRTREELEVGVDDPDALLLLLDRLGFRRTFRYQKYRETWALGAAQVMLDQVPAGHFAEVEGEAAEVRAVALRLGLEGPCLVVEGYGAILLRWLRAQGRAGHEALFEGEAGRG